MPTRRLPRHARSRLLQGTSPMLSVGCRRRGSRECGRRFPRRAKVCRQGNFSGLMQSAHGVCRLQRARRRSRLQSPAGSADGITIDLPGGRDRCCVPFQDEDRGNDGSLATIFIFWLGPASPTISPAAPSPLRDAGRGGALQRPASAHSLRLRLVPAAGQHAGVVVRRVGRVRPAGDHGLQRLLGLIQPAQLVEHPTVG